jgi:hypothetical protein
MSASVRCIASAKGNYPDRRREARRPQAYATGTHDRRWMTSVRRCVCSPPSDRFRQSGEKPDLCTARGTRRVNCAGVLCGSPRARHSYELCFRLPSSSFASEQSRPSGTLLRLHFRGPRSLRHGGEAQLRRQTEVQLTAQQVEPTAPLLGPESFYLRLECHG